MKVSDIEAVSKKYGWTLLKDTNPELFQAELSAGPSTVFLSRPSPTPASEDEELEMDFGDEDDEEEDEGPEPCPICDAECDWGGMSTCEHYLGVVLDGNLLESKILQSIQQSWSTLCRHEAANHPVVLWALASSMDLSISLVETFVRHSDPYQADLDDMAFVDVAIAALGVVEGRYITTNGMLSGSAMTLYAPDRRLLETWADELSGLASAIEVAAAEYPPEVRHAG